MRRILVLLAASTGTALAQEPDAAPPPEVQPEPEPLPLPDPREDRNGLPVAPSKPAPLRAGLHLRGLVQTGDALDGFGTAAGFMVDWWLGRHVAVGLTADYLVFGARDDAGPSLQALWPGLRVRLSPQGWQTWKDGFRLELEAAGGARLRLGGPGSTALTYGGGLNFAWRRFGIGARYLRATTDAARDVFEVTVEMTSRAQSEGWPRRPQKLPRPGLGMHILLGGWAFADGLGPVLPGVALELPVYFGGKVVPFVRWDLLWTPGIDHAAAALQTALLGLQLWELGETRIGVTVAGGYTLVQGAAPRAVGHGAVADVGLWYWIDRQGLHLGVHGRFGVEPDNRDLRMIFASIGARQIFNH